MAPKACQHVCVIDRFYPFCHYLEPKRTSQLANCPHNRPVVLLLAANKGLIDLECVKWQLCEIRQAGITRPEIINGEAKTERLLVTEGLPCAFKVVGHNGFGQFQFQIFRLQTGLLNNLLNAVYYPVVTELNC